MEALPALRVRGVFPFGHPSAHEGTQGLAAVLCLFVDDGLQRRVEGFPHHAPARNAQCQRVVAVYGQISARECLACRQHAGERFLQLVGKLHPVGAGWGVREGIGALERAISRLTAFGVASTTSS